MVLIIISIHVLELINAKKMNEGDKIIIMCDLYTFKIVKHNPLMYHHALKLNKYKIIEKSKIPEDIINTNNHNDTSYYKNL